MTQRAMFPGFPGSRPTQLRTRAAVLAAAAGVSVAMGAGIAGAADGGSQDGSTAATQADTRKDAQPAQPKASDWVTPVKQYELSSGYGLGGNMWSTKHSGQDFAVDTGTDVNTVHGGTVVKAGPNGAGDGPAYGNAIVIQHPNGSYSQYAHLSRIDVNIGEQVKTGEHIAKSGSTGNSSGPHLHFEVRTTPNYGSAVNPSEFMAQHGLKF